MENSNMISRNSFFKRKTGDKDQSRNDYTGERVSGTETMIRYRDILLPQIEDLFRETVGFRGQPYGCLMELTQWECRLVIYAEAGSV